MDKLYNNKYRIPSARHSTWDYRWQAAYFITICTHNKVHFFGEIINGKMRLSPVGAIADLLWHEIPKHTTANIELGEFVVMPNHIHGILILHGDDGDIGNDGDAPNDVQTSEVETLRATSLQQWDQDRQREKSKFMSDISPKSNSISTIIRSYKSAVTKHANRLQFDFKWQARFHDHIIRNPESFQRISNYIKNNPLNWTQDRFHSS